MHGDNYNGPYLVVNSDIFSSGLKFQRNWIPGAMAIPSAMACVEILQLLNERDSIEEQLTNLNIMLGSCQNDIQVNILTTQLNGMNFSLQSIDNKLMSATHNILSGPSGTPGILPVPNVLSHQSSTHFETLPSPDSSAFSGLRSRATTCIPSLTNDSKLPEQPPLASPQANPADVPSPKEPNSKVTVQAADSEVDTPHAPTIDDVPASPEVDDEPEEPAAGSLQARYESKIDRKLRELREQLSDLEETHETLSVQVQNAFQCKHVSADLLNNVMKIQTEMTSVQSKINLLEANPKQKTKNAHRTRKGKKAANILLPVRVKGDPATLDPTILDPSLIKCTWKPGQHLMMLDLTKEMYPSTGCEGVKYPFMDDAKMSVFESESPF